MNWEKTTNMFQLVGAAIGIPAAAVGTYAVFRTNFSTDAICQAQRTSILASIDKNLPADAKFTLLHKDVDAFSKNCAAADPDAHAIFQAVLHETQKAMHRAPAQPRTASAAPAQPPAAQPAEPTHGVVAGNFGVSAAGEKRGWVGLDRRDAGHVGESAFDGYSAGTLPAVDAVLTALWPAPVWPEPAVASVSDQARIQGRLAAGGCVRVLSARTSRSGRAWAEVTPADCPKSPVVQR